MSHCSTAAQLAWLPSSQSLTTPVVGEDRCLQKGESTLLHTQEKASKRRQGRRLWELAVRSWGSCSLLKNRLSS